MESFEKFISIQGPQLQLYFFVGLFILSWNIENIAGVIFNYKKWKHVFLNMPFILTNIPGQLLIGFLFVKTIAWTSLHQFGFLHYLPTHNNSLLSFIIAFIFLDFGEYVYHRIMHIYKGFWRFHIVHHSDTVVDVSTTLREHPGENFIRLSFTLLWVFISGTAFWMLMLRQIIQTFSTLFAHINYRLPEKVDSIISLIFITPNLHQVHHHYKQPYTDCNFGDVLSIWDKLFGTFKRLPAKGLIFGVDKFMAKEDIGNFKLLAMLPFGKFWKDNNAAPKIISIKNAELKVGTGYDIKPAG